MYSADHIAFAVSDLDRAIAFYTTVLGLELLSRERDEEHGEEFAFLRVEGANLELLRTLGDAGADGVPREPKPPYCPHFALATDDINGLVANLRHRNLPVLKGPMEIPGRVRWLYVADPDGNVIEFVQWLDRQ